MPSFSYTHALKEIQAATTVDELDHFIQGYTYSVELKTMTAQEKVDINEAYLSKRSKLNQTNQPLPQAAKNLSSTPAQTSGMVVVEKEIAQFQNPPITLSDCKDVLGSSYNTLITTTSAYERQLMENTVHEAKKASVSLQNYRDTHTIDEQDEKTGKVATDEEFVQTDKYVDMAEVKDDVHSLSAPAEQDSGSANKPVTAVSFSLGEIIGIAVVVSMVAIGVHIFTGH